MKKMSFTFTLVVLIFAFINSSVYAAISIDLSPAVQSFNIGDSISLDISISGLDDFAPDSLSVFDIDVNFDPAILSFNNVVFGDSFLGDQLDLFGFGSIAAGGLVGPGTVNIFELSFDLPGDLDALQAGSFTLANVTFDTLAVGTSPLSLATNTLGDSLGNPLLVANLGGGSITVVQPAAVIPEPSTYALFVLGVLAVITYRHQKNS